MNGEILQICPLGVRLSSHRNEGDGGGGGQKQQTASVLTPGAPPQGRRHHALEGFPPHVALPAPAWRWMLRVYLTAREAHSLS